MQTGVKITAELIGRPVLKTILQSSMKYWFDLLTGDSVQQGLQPLFWFFSPGSGQSTDSVNFNLQYATFFALTYHHAVDDELFSV